MTSERISINAAARQMGVSDRTVRRWLSEEDFPSEENAALVRELVKKKSL
jgi:DNA-binding transcriptional regulator YiaG